LLNIYLLIFTVWVIPLGRCAGYIWWCPRAGMQERDRNIMDTCLRQTRKCTGRGNNADIK